MTNGPRSFLSTFSLYSTKMKSQEYLYYGGLIIRDVFSEDLVKFTDVGKYQK